ncbi:rhomboid family domain-containing protein, putative [Eimeria acervulina]|uniref:Rhomboid-like protease n=1 Tax=Eimeria acervulina TaxID=5801 RepID=U6GC57_EIMAC|nr:rhomboid family domain-containing protein, putative [Eimeria acervulina]CDI76923.1 rhomboid family domain-containing protein, putative [Eimeria acervulina]
MSDIESQRVLGAGIPRTGRLIDVAFPNISLDKSIVLITLVQVGVYILSCAMSSAFEPTERVLYQLGATYGPAIRHFQAWRLIMPVFLHVGIVHLLFNILFILHMGLDKEIKYGRTNFLMLYFSSGCRCQYSGIWYANVASLLLINSLETKHLIGLVGSILAEILMVWHKLDERTRNMYTLDITIFGALMILLSYGQTGNKLRTAAYETFDAKPVCI